MISPKKIEIKRFVKILDEDHRIEILEEILFPYTEKPSSENSTVSYTVRGIIKDVVAIETNAKTQLDVCNKAVEIEAKLKVITKYNPFNHLGFTSEVDYYLNH